MTKNDELKAAAQELRSVAKHLLAVADKLEPEPEAELSYTDVRKVLAEKSRAGHTAKIKEILISHGADKLSEIDPTNYEALMKDAEVIGNGS